MCTKTYKKGEKESASKLDFLKMGMQLNYQHHWSVMHKTIFLLKFACSRVYLPVVVCSKPMTEHAKFLKTLMQLPRIVDNMPVTWCYDVEENQKYCNPGFPIGCLVTTDGRAKDACVINVSSIVFSPAAVWFLGWINRYFSFKSERKHLKAWE